MRAVCIGHRPNVLLCGRVKALADPEAGFVGTAMGLNFTSFLPFLKVIGFR